VKPLKRFHTDEIYKVRLHRLSLEFWRRQSTKDIVASLRPGADQPLSVKEDGTIVQGNTRIKVLIERGYNVNELPRDWYLPGEL
jgi:hypothetical protein